ncbi:MAG: hypothetical protein GY719_35455 [bacterium]|nr:hypothetical protein [bacterium]
MIIKDESTVSIPARTALVALLLLPALVPVAEAATTEVKLTLPVRARLDLAGRKTIAPAPFIMVSREGEGRIPGRDIDVQGEFERYLFKLVRRETDLKVIEVGPLDYPTYDLDMLGRDQDFWRALGERTQADLILAGSLDFDIQDRSGYRREEYVSPFDGQVYQRQVLVEETGFEYDIVMQVYDGITGELLYSDNFKDFKQYEGESADPLSGMFQNLYSLEDRIVGIFAQKEVEATRILFAD